MLRKKHQLFYHIMMLPGILFILLFSFVPMFGIVMAFQNFEPYTGIFNSAFVGLDNFRRLLIFPDSKQVFFNTLIIALSKIILGIVVPVTFALILNECRSVFMKRTVQTIVYLPNFMSWVILGVIIGNVFNAGGIVNSALVSLGITDEAILFLYSNTWFRPVVILTDVWKGYGFTAVIYISAITGIDPALYEVAEIDGANRLQKMMRITLPSIRPTIVLMSTLALGNVLNAGFDQIYNLYSPLVYKTGDIIDTYVYRLGLVQMQYSFATAVGLFKSVISFFLIITSYKLADRFAGYRIF